MHIAIDTSPLHNGHTNRGVGGYTKNLIESLHMYEPAHAYIPFDSKHQHPPKADIIHYPFFDPFFLTLPFHSIAPSIVTVHDLIPIVFPEHFPKGLRGGFRWQIQKYSLQKKQRIITDSECSKKDIVRLTGIPEKKIDVIYLAPSLKLLPATDNFDVLKKQYGIQNDYFLYVGDVNWNKNIPGLLRAYAQFINNQLYKNKELRTLILVGKAFLNQNLKETIAINQMCRELGIEKYIIRTGYIPDDSLVSLYSHARSLIQPSLYEGFGLPVLDAMALGCPVICSWSSSLSEIAGPSIMVDAKNYISIADGMARIISLTKEERKILIKESSEWAKRFTWKKVAKETVQSYEKILGTL